MQRTFYKKYSQTVEKSAKNIIFSLVKKRSKKAEIRRNNRRISLLNAALESFSTARGQLVDKGIDKVRTENYLCSFGYMPRAAWRDMF